MNVIQPKILLKSLYCFIYTRFHNYGSTKIVFILKEFYLSGLPSGIYFVKGKCKERIVIRKY